MTKLMIGLMMAGVLLVGCDKGADGGAKSEGTGKSGAAAEKSGSGDSTGAKECDDYIKAIEDCAKTNPMIGKPMLDSIAGTKEGFKAGIANAATKDATIQSCKSSADTIKSTCK